MDKFKELMEKVYRSGLPKEVTQSLGDCFSTGIADLFNHKSRFYQEQHFDRVINSIENLIDELLKAHGIDPYPEEDWDEEE